MRKYKSSGIAGARPTRKGALVYGSKDNHKSTVGTEDTDDLTTSQVLNLTNTMLITEQDTNLTGSQTLLGELGDKLVDFLVGGLEPAGSTAAVREAGARNTLTIKENIGWLV